MQDGTREETWDVPDLSSVQSCNEGVTGQHSKSRFICGEILIEFLNNGFRFGVRCAGLEAVCAKLNSSFYCLSLFSLVFFFFFFFFFFFLSR